jgi:hypothetical protein
MVSDFPTNPASAADTDVQRPASLGSSGQAEGGRYKGKPKNPHANRPFVAQGKHEGHSA